MQRYGYLFGSIIFSLYIQGMSTLGDSLEEPLEHLSVPEYTQMLDDVLTRLNPFDGSSDGDLDGNSNGDLDGDFAMYLRVDKKNKENKKCKKCVLAHVKSTMTYALQEVHKICQHTECPALKKSCKAAAKHPQATYGYLLVKTRAFATAVAYCIGRRRCTEGHHPDPDFGAATARVFTEGAFADFSDSEIPSENPSFPAVTLTPPPSRPSLKCIGRMTKKILSKVEKKIDKVCENPKCHWLEWFCDFRTDQPEEAAGIAYAYVDPEKYAAGYCAAGSRSEYGSRYYLI